MGDEAKTREALLKELTALRAKLNKGGGTKRKAALPEQREVPPAAQGRIQFLSYIAHELKTPLNSLLGFIQLLRNGTFGLLTPEQGRAMMRMNADVLELVHLVDNLLDFSKIDSGKMSVQVVAANPRELVERVAMLFEPFLREKGLQLEQVIDPDCPATLMTDPLKIKSVLTNLLSNAVKFTPRGQIRLGLRARSGPRGIRITVSDTGIGIAPQDLPNVFKEHKRGEVRESSPRSGSGSGLGLAIVGKMVSALGGSVRVESKPGAGTTFTVDIPEGSPP